MTYTTDDTQSCDTSIDKDVSSKKRSNACTPNPCFTTNIPTQDLNSQCSRKTHVDREEAKTYC
jgi:hypothetical protein